MLRNKIFGNTLPNKMLFHNVLYKILPKRVLVLVFLRVQLFVPGLSLCGLKIVGRLRRFASAVVY